MRSIVAVILVIVCGNAAAQQPAAPSAGGGTDIIARMLADKYQVATNSAQAIGQIQLDFDTTSSARSFIRSGKVRALAVMTPQRSPELPDVREKLRGLGGEPSSLTTEQFGAMNKADFDRFGKLVKDANIKAD